MFKKLVSGRSAAMLAGALMLCTATTAHALPSIDFDVDGPGSSATIGITSSFCIGCFATPTVAPGLDAEIFSLANGESHTFDFFDVTVGGVIGAATADAAATLAFTLPPGVSVSSTGAGGFATFLGVLSAGALIWDAATPVEVALTNGSTFDVDLSDIIAFGIGNTATVQATITATNVVPEPTTLALFGVGLAALGVAKRRRANRGDS